ncbi:MAG TPA: hypothetical protein VKT31_05960 [Solirubrobacteraceae bacterium]|nr:hypothetical protein [Solirubrobacteraceae bacterium]
MKRKLITAAVAFACAALVPAAALAGVIELGVPSTPLVAPTCPKGISPTNCTIILTRVTAVETLRDGVAYPTTVKQAGRIVAFTVGLSRLSTDRTTAHNDIHLLDSAFGGTTRLGITILQRVGKANQWRWKTVAQSPVFKVQPYLGQVVQFPLTTTLPVLPGEVVALTTPTWAPVLSIDLTPSKFAYRQSRTNCAGTPNPNAAQTVGQTTVYKCDYPGTRLEYSATEISNPVAANPIHARDVG